MRFLIAGDSHGEFQTLTDVIRNSVNGFGIDAVIQVGDFGFFKQYIESIQHPFQVPVYAIDGNHEDHKWLKKQKSFEKLNLFYMKRGTVQEFDGRTVCFVGGAMNADRKQTGSIQNRTTNYLLNSEADEIVSELNQLDKPIDLMVTHSVPHSIGVGIQGLPFLIPLVQQYVIDALGVSVGPLNDCGENVLTRLWSKLIHKPRNWVFGHFHMYHQAVVENCNFWCVGSTDTSDKRMDCVPHIYDTALNEIEAFPRDTV